MLLSRGNFRTGTRGSPRWERKRRFWNDGLRTAECRLSSDRFTERCCAATHWLRGRLPQLGLEQILRGPSITSPWCCLARSDVVYVLPRGTPGSIPSAPGRVQGSCSPLSRIGSFYGGSSHAYVIRTPRRRGSHLAQKGIHHPTSQQRSIYP